MSEYIFLQDDISTPYAMTGTFTTLIREGGNKYLTIMENQIQNRSEYNTRECFHTSLQYSIRKHIFTNLNNKGLRQCAKLHICVRVVIIAVLEQ